MAAHAPAWAAVGAEKAPVNQPRVAGEKPSRARCAELTMRPSCTSALTIALTCEFASDGGAVVMWHGCARAIRPVAVPAVAWWVGVAPRGCASAG
ncbi:hypothetical protein GCM10023084_29750 [Streptomyces lacrimifluminis]|uniref:Uncharacterized protein n=1 Tax=Streptomyces lacrimifluminis TaxID=1500077 RepID=A0A917NU66_9ACTN|nr:hypothetical protein GCM10012282_26370 [Streptomyces lacrimifluminis]